jgi:hypothetical protein
MLQIYMYIPKTTRLIRLDIRVAVKGRYHLAPSVIWWLMADPEAHPTVERTGTLKSLTSILKVSFRSEELGESEQTACQAPTIRIKRQHLARYSWLPDVLRYKGSVCKILYSAIITQSFPTT